MSLVDRLYDYLNSQSRANTIDYIIKMNEKISCNEEEEESRGGNFGGEIERSEWCDYLVAVREFIESLEKFLSLTPENSFTFNLHTNNSLIRKPNYNQELFELAVRLVAAYHRPKSLKQLARFKIRRLLFEHVDSTWHENMYNERFLKRDHIEQLVRALDLPNGLCNYILCKNVV